VLSVELSLLIQDSCKGGEVLLYETDELRRGGVLGSENARIPSWGQFFGPFQDKAKRGFNPKHRIEDPQLHEGNAH
jgi:hypothetical protein